MIRIVITLINCELNNNRPLLNAATSVTLYTDVDRIYIKYFLYFLHKQNKTNFYVALVFLYVFSIVKDPYYSKYHGFEDNVNAPRPLFRLRCIPLVPGNILLFPRITKT